MFSRPGSLPGFASWPARLAGSTGLPPPTFVAANALGALCHVPAMVAAGYGAAYGLGVYLA